MPGLKRTALPGVMLTSAPVRGLRPMPVLRADIEYSKAAQLNPVARSKRFFQAFKDRVDSRFRLVARETGLGDHLMDDVLFNQCLYPEGY